MGRRLILCSDGTWKEPQKLGVTNVVRLTRAILPRDRKGVDQVVFYDWGVGTGTRSDRALGGALGKGIDRNIQDAYRFLVHNHVTGDRIFLFGFSRGAYTVRSLVGMIRNCGLLHKKHAARIPEAYERYRSRLKRDHPDSPRSREFCRLYARKVRIEFLGVWDTVGSLGLPLGVFKRLSARRYSFHDTSISSIVRHASHALAIDEKRPPFTPTIWKTKPRRRNTEQVWFTGVHSDVGGGYTDDTGLADKTLLWMAGRARQRGLALSRSYLSSVTAPEPQDTLHDSFKGFYRVAWDPRERRIGVTNRDESVHASAIARYRQHPEYRPRNLRRYLEREGLSPASD